MGSRRRSSSPNSGADDGVAVGATVAVNSWGIVRGRRRGLALAARARAADVLVELAPAIDLLLSFARQLRDGLDEVCEGSKSVPTRPPFAPLIVHA